MVDDRFPLNPNLQMASKNGQENANLASQKIDSADQEERHEGDSSKSDIEWLLIGRGPEAERSGKRLRVPMR